MGPPSFWIEWQTPVKTLPYLPATSFVGNNYQATKMHSSRMCTICCSGHREGGLYPSMHWAGGVYPSMHWVGVYPGQGAVRSRGSAQGGGFLPGVGGVICPGEGCVYPKRSVWPGGVCQTPPPLWTEWLTEAWENITLLQLCCGW